MPTTIQRALEQPVIADMVRWCGVEPIVDYVQFELIRVASLVSVGNNLNNSQVQFIAEQLVQTYPHETLADFKLCFERGCMGKYGDVFRMDGIVLGGWMQKYLDEKYTIVEKQHKQPDVHTPTDKPTGEGYELFKGFVKQMTDQVRMGIRPMTDQDAKVEGKQKPKRHASSTGYTYFDVPGLPVRIYATTWEHALEIVSLMIERGDIESTEGPEPLEALKTFIKNELTKQPK